MQAFVAFLVVIFLLGGTGAGRHLRRWPILLLAASTCAAASFYSLSVVL